MATQWSWIHSLQPTLTSRYLAPSSLPFQHEMHQTRYNTMQWSRLKDLFHRPQFLHYSCNGLVGHRSRTWWPLFRKWKTVKNRVLYLKWYEILLQIIEQESKSVCTFQEENLRAQMIKQFWNWLSNLHTTSQPNSPCLWFSQKVSSRPFT